MGNDILPPGPEGRSVDVPGRAYSVGLDQVAPLGTSRTPSNERIPCHPSLVAEGKALADVSAGSLIDPEPELIPG